MIKRNISTFREAQDYLLEIPRFTTKHSMDDTKAFLHSLGDPDRKLKIIHVAGTNGKGSVCAYLRCILEAAGHRVAVFTSPHLVDIRERFVVDGEMISQEDFLRVFLHVYELLDWKALKQDAQGAYHPTFFEYLFFMGVLYFAEKAPDLCILETGLGGRLDATNSVHSKELTVITRIGLDHMEYLGDTPEKIATEKAGIFRPGTPAVCWDTSGEVRHVFEEMAAALGISVDFVSKNEYVFKKFMNKTIDFSLRTGYYGYVNLTLNTIAAYQMENVALAVRAIEMWDLGKTVTEQHIRSGVAACFWAGRMEEVLPEVFVDGAHNQDGIRAFLETVAADGLDMPHRSLLFGVVKDKEYESMAEELASSGLFHSIGVTCMQTRRSARAEQLERIFARYPHCSVNVSSSVEEGFRRLLSGRRSGERVYVAGSLYLAGEIKELIVHDKF